MEAKLSRRALAAVAIGAAAWSPHTTVQAQSKLVVVPSLQCPLGCGGVVYNVQLSNMMARSGSSVSLAPQETPGYMYNIRYMDKNYDKAKNTTFGTEDMVLQFGPHGGKGLLRDSLPEPVKNKFQFLWGIAATAQGRFFVTFDPKIKTVADMKGKRVNLGLLTQSDWGLSGRIVLDTYGITGKNTKISYVTPAVMTDQLINGTVDVVTSAILGDPGTNKWATGGPLVKIGAAAQASGRKLYYISVDDATMGKINKKYGTTHFTATLPAGTLPQQDAPVTIGLNRAYQAVTTHFPADVAYELTKATIKFGPELKKEGGFWNFFSPEGLVAGLNECNTHPGALKAFKEAGIWELRHKGGPEAKIPGC
jgi:hypothetical protein